jgi:hypothetical protein
MAQIAVRLVRTRSKCKHEAGTPKAKKSMRRFKTVLCLLLACTGAAAKAATPGSTCGTPEVILQRYIDAIGGDAAVSQLKSLAIVARAAEPQTFAPRSTERSKYVFKWQFPNRVAVHWHGLLSSGAGLFDGAHWSNFEGRISHNDDATPKANLEMRARYPYNDSPQWMVYRIAANPILLATSKDLYSSFELLPGSPATCVLQARGKTEWKTERDDQLTFDATTSLLIAWKVQAGLPGHISYVEFRFDDYRHAGSVRIPFVIYFDFYKITFTLTRAIPNLPLSEGLFQPNSK